MPYSVIMMPEDAKKLLVLAGRAPQTASENGGLPVASYRWYLKPGSYLIAISWNGPEGAMLGYNPSMNLTSAWADIVSVPAGTAGQIRKSPPVEVGAETWMTLLPKLATPAATTTVSNQYRMVISVIPMMKA